MSIEKPITINRQKNAFDLFKIAPIYIYGMYDTPAVLIKVEIVCLRKIVRGLEMVNSWCSSRGWRTTHTTFLSKSENSADVLEAFIVVW